jgi:hypothetical protein
MTFVAFMFTRVPVWRDFLNDIAVNIAKHNLLSLASDKKSFYQSCIDFEKKEGKPLGIDFEEMRQIALNDGIGLQQGLGFNLRAMFDSAADIAKELARMGWQILYAPPGKSFVTSDAPVFTLVTDGHGQATIGVGFGWDETEVYFPLNKRACLRLKQGIEPKAIVIGPERMDMINSVTMANATQYLYSSEGYRVIARKFDQEGCRTKAKKNAYMPTPPTKAQLL